MGYPSLLQVTEAAKHLALKQDGTFIRTNGLWHVLIFLRHKACHGGESQYTLESYDLAQAAFDLNGLSLPISERSRDVYFEPGATQGNEIRKLFRHREGPRQTYLNRITTGLTGAGVRQPRLFTASSPSLPSTVSLAENWIEILRNLGDNALVLDSLVHSLVTWLFRFGVPISGGATAHIADHASTGRMSLSPDVRLSPIPTHPGELRRELGNFFGLRDSELTSLLPELEHVRSNEWMEESPISIVTFKDDLLHYFDVNQLQEGLEETRENIFGVGSNTIFFGPPGTGKSTRVDSIVSSSPRVRTQFHPEYGHADLIGSYRPVVGREVIESDQIIGHDGIPTRRPVNYFDFVPGPLTEALVSAFGTESGPQKPDHVFLIIEEINRGDCAAIFGDAFQLLDRDDTGQSQFGITPKPELLAYFKSKGVNYDICEDGMLYLPPNLSLLATMNTSDQSLYAMDAAFKRRWQWVACPIDFTELSRSTSVRPFLNDSKSSWDWINMLEVLNKNIVQDRMEDKQIGPWFIKPAHDGSVSWEAFLNKCLFYLWHDVFKDEQRSELSPFKTDGPAVFGDVQKNIRVNGLAAGFKPGFLKLAGGVVDVFASPPSDSADAAPAVHGE